MISLVLSMIYKKSAHQKNIILTIDNIYSPNQEQVKKGYKRSPFLLYYASFLITPQAIFSPESPDG